MATLLTIADIQDYEPDILNYGVPSFTDEITKGQNDVFRDLRIEWWPTFTFGRYDISVLNSGEEDPDEDLFTASQLTRAAVYQTLGYHIYPKLAKFDEQVDIFERKMEYYRKEYDREFEKILKDGIEYDADSSGTVTNTEKQAQYFNRLIR